MQFIKNKLIPNRSVASKIIFSAVDLLCLTAQVGCNQSYKHLECHPSRSPNIVKIRPVPPQRISSLHAHQETITLSQTPTTNDVTLYNENRRYALTNDVNALRPKPRR
ncbi:MULTISPECIES: hypothetical protein [Candidatus Cardinium]|uniref:hypothetical protein n=1 Tax=Candidatus Cardinium TaxID=273135 RepID=UPI001FAAD6A7|nr:MULTISPECIES: hypothetical protein [Cardinium]